MAAWTETEKQEVYESFNDLVNLQPKELEDWLETEPSQEVGHAPDGGESTGHASGRKIVDIKRTKKADLSDQQYDHMRKVVGYIRRHTAQRPDGDVRDTAWRYSLMNWGHDPMKT